MSRKSKYYKDALDRLKEERGPVDPDFLEQNKQRSRMIRGVSKAIKDENLHTVPEIAQKMNYDSKDVLNAVNYLMKFDGLKLLNKSGEYAEYGFGDGH
ncbi:MAG: hypothetical protein INQ03_19700 [Candidatus Heimdallarchaeota archaeon]|nr:hypothetical protein [Candidatus Heimdallarchaeota archaeon]